MPKAPYLTFVHERDRVFACYPVPLLARPRATSSAQANKSAILYYTHRLADFADPGSPGPYLWVLTWGSWGLVLTICPRLNLESRRGPDVSLQSGPLSSVVATTLYCTTNVVVLRFTTQRSPFSSFESAGQCAPEPVPVQTKTCWDGSTINADATCPAQPETFTCWDGTLTYDLGTCPVQPVARPNLTTLRPLFYVLRSSLETAYLSMICNLKCLVNCRKDADILYISYQLQATKKVPNIENE